MRILLGLALLTAMLMTGDRSGPRPDGLLLARGPDSRADPAVSSSLAARQLEGQPTIKGEIRFIDPQRGELMLQTKETSHLLLVAPDAIIVRGQEAVELNTVKMGDTVTVWIKQEEDMGPMIYRVEIDSER